MCSAPLERRAPVLPLHCAVRGNGATSTSSPVPGHSAPALKHVRAPAVTDLAWESPLQIIRYPDPRLRAPNARIGVFDERLARLSRELFEVMYNGCAAPSASDTAFLNVLSSLERTRCQTLCSIDWWV